MSYQDTGRRQRRGSGFVGAVMLVLTGVLAAFLCMRALYPVQYSDAVERYSDEFGVDSRLVYAVIHTESGFDPNACSEVGAVGLMQIMPDTFMWLQGRLEPEADMPPEALYDPEVNIRYGVYFLSMLDEMFGDDVLTVAAYHAGQNKVSKWLEENKIPQHNCTADDIPSSVTGHYVRKVQKAYNIYEKLYG